MWVSGKDDAHAIADSARISLICAVAPSSTICTSWLAPSRSKLIFRMSLDFLIDVPVITDRANGLRHRIVFVLRQGADLVVHFTAHNLPLQDEQGKAIAGVKWLKGGHAKACQVLSRRAWISYQGSRIGLRCVTLRLSQQQRGAVKRRKKRAATMKQQQVQADTLYLAGWVLLVTNLPLEQWSEQQVVCLSQARWYIELVFKGIKQLLQQHQLRCTTAAIAQPTLTALSASMGLTGRGKQRHSPGDARGDGLHAAGSRGRPRRTRGQESVLLAAGAPRSPE